LVHPSCTTEEAYLAAKLTRALGSSNVDHRLRQRDFRDAAADARQPALGLPIAEVDALTGALVIGSNLRAELPLLAHRLRKAAVKSGAKVAFVDTIAREYRFPVAVQIASEPAHWAQQLAGVLAAVIEKAGVQVGEGYSTLLRGVVATNEQRAAAEALLSGSKRVVWLGALALRHPAWADLRSLAVEIGRVAGATLAVLAEGGNAAGASIAGALPHRVAGGSPADVIGLHASAMLESSQRAYLLVGAIEPQHDLAAPAVAESAFDSAACVVALTPYASKELLARAHVLLPIGSFAETSGSYVNLDGRWQSQAAVSKLPGEARPAWKVLRVLGNLLELSGFDQESSEEVRSELQTCMTSAAGSAAPSVIVTQHIPAIAAVSGSADLEIGDLDVPMYSIDAVLRRSPALQQTGIARRAAEGAAQ
jgi:NADH-quinone oxidoreductase subunit G